jgi:hypothetical protein
LQDVEAVWIIFNTDLGAYILIQRRTRKKALTRMDGYYLILPVSDAKRATEVHNPAN